MIPRLRFRVKKSGIPIIGKKELDYLGEELIMDFCTEAMCKPMAIDIERFVQSYLKLEQDYQYLSSNGVYLGMTVFNDTNKVPIYDPITRRAEYVSAKAGTVIIDHRLLEDNQKHRFRFTLGHESSHRILHTGCFTYQPDQLSLFGNKDIPLIRCRMEEPIGGLHKPVTLWTDKDWIEWQANRLSSAILMPRKMIYKLITGNITDKRIINTATCRFAPYNYPDMVSLVTETFNVSKEAAAYRLRELGLVDKKLDMEVLTGVRNIMDVFVY